MKKIAILTSVLALAACGGGSGGGAGTAILSPAESNARVTGMNSFIVIGGSNPTVNPNARTASTGILQSDGGTRYDLENVIFKTIPTSGVISELAFHTDENGKIVSIEYLDAEEIMAAHPGSDITVGPIKRDGDTNVFVEHVVLDEEFGDRAGQTVNLPTEYVSYAKDLGLKYSDFGVLKTDIASTGIPEVAVWGVLETPFAGGYNAKNITKDQMQNLATSETNEKIVFTGLAKGRVSYHDWDAGIGGADVALEGGLTDNAATLTFKSDGSQTLAANFENWAAIRAVKSANGKNQFIVDEIHDGVDPKFHLATSPSDLVDPLDGGTMGEHTMTMQAGYYGDDNAPNEAVGLVQYQYAGGDPVWVEMEQGENGAVLDPVSGKYGRWDVENHINVDLGFGGIKE